MMCSRPRPVLSILVVLLLAIAPVLHARAAQPYMDMYTAITQMSIDPAEVYTVTNAMIQREAGEFTFENGTIALTRPIAGSVRAVVFYGNGGFDFAPPTTVEQEQLERFYKTRALSVNISSTVMFIADSTIEELRPFLTKGGAADALRPMENVLAAAVGYIHSADQHYVQPQIIQSFLENATNGMFYAHIECKDGPLFFSVNPYEEEEVSLLRLAKKTRIGTYAHDVICQFHTIAEHLHGIDPAEDKSVIAVDKYTIDVSLSTAMDMVAKAELQFTGLADGVQWIPFSLYHELDIKSAVWGSTSMAEYFKGKDNSTLWIHLDQPMKKGEKYTLKLDYKGGVMNRYGDWLVLWSSTGWYPRYGYRKKALFDVTYHFPERYELAGVGNNVSEDEDDGVKTSRWVTKLPIRNCSFNVGKFTKKEASDDRIPPVVLLMSDGTTKSMKEDVKNDIVNSLAFFQELYGKLPIDRFYATPIPLEHGEAFPGLIHLSASTFEETDQYGVDEMFRAHEVAHQWWGIGVDINTYHDQWLSEAFAHYSGLMYMQLIRKDNDLFFKQLEKWSDRIQDNRKTIFGTGVQAGPVSLGYRTNTSSTSGDYSLIIYEKGAWVLHMLRNIFIDIRSLKEDRFFAMMKDFYTTYQGQRATTDDFHGIVEKHIGMDMDWFFNQWVYSTAVPKYTYAYKTEKTADGKYQVTMRVKQENVPDGFQMPIPLSIDFGGDQFVRLRIMVSKPEEDILLPPLPMKPKEIKFNIFNSVLCEVTESSWE